MQELTKFIHAFWVDWTTIALMINWILLHLAVILVILDVSFFVTVDFFDVLMNSNFNSTENSGNSLEHTIKYLLCACDYFCYSFYYESWKIDLWML